MGEHKQLIQSQSQYQIEVQNHERQIAHSCIRPITRQFEMETFIGANRCIAMRNRSRSLHVYNFAADEIQRDLALPENCMNFWSTVNMCAPVLSKDLCFFYAVGNSKELGTAYYAWEIETGRCVGRIEMRSRARHDLLLPDHLAVAYQQDSIIYKVPFDASQKSEALWIETETIQNLFLSRNGKLMAYRCGPGITIKIVDLTAKKVIASIDFKQIADTPYIDIRDIRSSRFYCSFTDDGCYLLVTAGDFSAKILYYGVVDVSTGNVKYRGKELVADKTSGLMDETAAVMANSGEWLYLNQRMIQLKTQKWWPIHLMHANTVLSRASFTKEQRQHILLDIEKVYIMAVHLSHFSVDDRTHFMDNEKRAILSDWQQIKMKDDLIFYALCIPEIEGIEKVQKPFIPLIMEEVIADLTSFLEREKLRLNPAKVAVVVTKFIHGFDFIEIATRRVLCSLERFKDGFVFITQGDQLSPSGWFYTNKPDCILIYEKATERLLTAEDSQRDIYYHTHNRKDLIREALLGNVAFSQGLQQLKDTYDAGAPVLIEAQERLLIEAAASDLTKYHPTAMAEKKGGDEDEIDD
ncbi:MAG: hypothetical protein PWP51_1482 [Clostridiales bacterium]|jgi:hypothetical protein|nr:hypothetical protein [Clostridiales bacterium]MDN5298929.1 hypothetical protein [Clostridiales bacterium]